MGEKLTCRNCEKEYEMFMFENYNLDLCPDCLEEFEATGKLHRDEFVDEVTHVVTCPKCGMKYGMEICDKKCHTELCPVYFFWDSLDSRILARWVEDDK